MFLAQMSFLIPFIVQRLLAMVQWKSRDQISFLQQQWRVLAQCLCKPGLEPHVSPVTTSPAEAQSA